MTLYVRPRDDWRDAIYRKQDHSFAAEMFLEFCGFDESKMCNLRLVYSTELEIDVVVVTFD